MRKETQLVVDIMESSKFGNLASHFVMDAVQKLANTVASYNPKVFTNPLHNGQAWYNVAREIKAKIDRRFS